MKNKIKNIIKAVSLKEFLFISCLSFVIIDFVISLSFQYPGIRLILNNYLSSTALIFLPPAVLFIIWMAISLSFRKEKNPSLRYALVVLSPILLLFFWRPEGARPSFMIPIAITLLTQICFFIILSKQEQLIRINISREKILIAAAITLYFAFFSYISIQRFNSFSFFNPKDFATYNQTFWNTINGRFFQNSAYGSNFACHNTIFFILPVPLYYILPHPLTLLILKTLLLSLSAIPFYLMSRDILKDISAAVLTLAYMLYPFLVSQNFAPPHEICYLPLFILFAYYFFRLKKFGPFMVFLVLSVSIKEHLASIALIFGLYSLFRRRSLRWILTPLLLGVGWGIFSLAIIAHFQEVYQAHPDSAWFLPFLKERFLSGEGSAFSSVISGLSYSNMSSWHNLRSVFLLLFPLGIITPLLSPVCLLGLPELIINLISDRPAMLSPLRHYNIIVSCFLLVGAIEGVKRLSDFKGLRSLKIRTSTLKLLLSVFILASTIIHSYLWLGLTEYPRNTAYIKGVKAAIALIPGEAFVTAPESMAVHVSSRESYSLLGSGKYGDYILINKDSRHLLKEREIINNYTQIFKRGGVWLLIRKERP